MAKVQFDVNINATLELEEAEWEALLEAYDGDEDDALASWPAYVEGTNLDSIYGEAWACSAEVAVM